MDNIDDTLNELRARITRLEKGGCTCDRPQWYFAQLISAYRCCGCGAIVSAQVLPERLKPKEGGA